MTLSAADLPITPEGRIYHLDLLPGDLAQSIIIVGDPDRVAAMGSEFLEQISVERFHRGLRTMTGKVRGSGLPASFVTSGMGTPSLEIVLQEIVALNEIDFQTRTRRAQHAPIDIIRVGTSGGLQARTELGTAIISRYALGMDNTGIFYDISPTDDLCVELEERSTALIREARVGKNVRYVIAPYAAKADEEISEALVKAAAELRVSHREGITVSNSGFFANQGRDVTRIAPAIPDLDDVLSKLELSNGLRVENMEMEASFLLSFMGALGYRSGAICPAIANRRKDTFAKDIVSSVRDATRVALRALEKLARSRTQTS